MSVFPVAGIRLGSTKAHIKYPDRLDLTVLEIASGSQVAGVFTQNAFCAEPVIVAKRHLEDTKSRYLLINTGYANAGNGESGLITTEQSCAGLAQLAGCEASEVLPFSTGVIGEPLPVERLLAGLPGCLQQLSENGWQRAAQAIMTTDTVHKLASRQLQFEGKTVTITGMSKGSGMIHPNMATMLGFVATDAAIAPELLQRLLKQLADQSFNQITVDGDTSTNDSCVLIATGKSAVTVSEQSADYQPFVEALQQVFVGLAQAIIRDGEGATKFVEVFVEQGADQAECRQVADTVALSPLVKTALFASDPNWGRILAAVGRAGLDKLVLSGINIFLGPVCIVERGSKAADYNEQAAAKVMAQTDIQIRVQLGRGEASSRVWTTDFSYDYVKINAEYRS